tara:strand:+ start:300 stop:770 length:471 start_codon:yes stop_codon:yes gene_type:complete
MANDDMKVDVKLDSEARKEIQTLKEQKRRIDKQIKNLSSSVKDEGKLEEWKMIHTLKQEVIGRLKKQGVSWKKFIDTPDWFEYAYYKQTGGIKRLLTAVNKPPAVATNTDEATMIKLAAEQRTKIVRRKKRNTKKKTDTSTTKSGKSEAQKTGGVV